MEDPDGDDDSYFFRGSSGNPEYTTHHSLPKSQDKSIRSDLDKLGLPVDIIDTADNIFQQMNTGTRRGEKRKQLIFHCVRTAYDLHKIPQDPKTLAETCEIDYSGITKASSMCSPVQTNYVSPVVVYEPKDYIPLSFTVVTKLTGDYIQFPEGTLDEMIQMAQACTRSDDQLLEEKPQMVAAAVVLYYLETLGIKIDRKKYAAEFKSSDMTIAKLRKQVEAAYNS